MVQQQVRPAIQPAKDTARRAKANQPLEQTRRRRPDGKIVCGCGRYPNFVQELGADDVTDVAHISAECAQSRVAHLVDGFLDATFLASGCAAAALLQSLEHDGLGREEL